MSKDSGIIYKTFVDAIRGLPKKKQLEALNVYFDFLFEEKEYTGSDVTIKALMTIITPTVEKARNRYEAAVENGKKGGAPKGNSNAKKQPENNQKNNQKSTRVQPENNQKTSKNNLNVAVAVADTVAVDVAVADTEADAVHPPTGACETRARARGQFKKVFLTDKQLDRLVKQYGESAVDKMIGKLDRFCAKTGRTYADFEAAISDWIEKDNGPPSGWTPEEDVNSDARKKLEDEINAKWG